VQIRILGAAAGGAFPQWNCSCANCARLRQGRFSGQARSQTQLAVSADARDWFLFNASPDLRYQLEAFPPLHPQATRHTPIAGIVLTCAEVDAALGLLLLREFQPITVYCTESVRRVLVEDNTLFQVLYRQPGQVTFINIVPGAAFDLGTSGLRVTSVSTAGGHPGFVPKARADHLSPDEAVLGFVLEHRDHRAAFFPNLSRVQPDWLALFQTCDVVLVDGTFWSDDELIRTHNTAKKAREMGHLPVEESIASLTDLRGRKIFIHINNTNPILDEDSPEHAKLRNAGWEVAYDGMKIIL
jgi:pyrroloquinoline quinone biosynthesis protein B